MKQQIVFIHGGETHDTYEQYIEYLKRSEFDPKKEGQRRWKHSLAENLGDGYEILMPQMPSKHNAKYNEWKIWFEKVTPFIKENAIFIGHSLGGIFLTKYLSENKFSKTIKATFLVAAPFDAEGTNYSPADFILPKSLEKFQKQGGTIYLYYSKDDVVVPLKNREKYKNALSTARSVIFEDKGHFNQEEFGEIVDEIKKI